MKKILTALLLVILGSFFGTAIFAQETATAEATATSEATTQIFTKERETEKIRQLRILYRDQVEVYRKSEKDFSIAKTNHEQVQTLAALEEAVNATRTVMADRLRVMITYAELIDAVLVETNGIELDIKEQTHSELVGMINLLKIHQENVQVAKDRPAMALLADDFEPVAIQYESLVYKTLSLIRIGKIQEVQDKAEIIEADIIKEHDSEEVSSVITAKRERAYAEVEKDFKVTNQDLAKLNEDFLVARRDGFKRGFYERILEDLSPVYARLSRTLDHLEELLSL